MPKFIDLSQEIYHHHPLHPNHQPTVVWTHHTFEDGSEFMRKANDLPEGEDPPLGYRTRAMVINDHGPTHVDAFSHTKRDGASIDEMPLDLFHGPGKAIEITQYPSDTEEYITVDDLEAACDEYDVELEDGDILLINTGHYEEHYPSDTYNEHFVGFDREATEWICDQGVKLFGVDAPGTDNTNDPRFVSHQVSRDREVTHIENLCNIDKVAGKDFTFIGFPLKIRDGTGGLMRGVAKLED